MEDDVGVRKLVKLIFDKHLPITAETKAPDPSIPDYFLTTEFSRKISCVLIARRLLLFNRWVDAFDAHVHKVLSSHVSYVTFVLKACLHEHYCSLNVFDSFISVCTLVGYFNHKTLKQTGVNFYDLNSDIAMEFYDSVLKKIFHRRGGLRRLIEYISHHRYAMWNSEVENTISTHDSTTPFCLNITEKLRKGLITDIKSEKLPTLDEKALEACISYAQKVISNTSVKLPTLPSYPDLIQTMVAYRRKQKAERAKVEGDNEASEPLDEFWPAFSNSDSKTSHNPKQEDDMAPYQNIIQVVTRLNHAKSSGLANSDNPIQNKADGIMKHFKETIESLIDVLDEYDK